jgi:hypothetical protein
MKRGVGMSEGAESVTVVVVVVVMVWMVTLEHCGN